MYRSVERDQTLRMLAPEPGGPAQVTGVRLANAQFSDVFMAQLKTDVVVQRVA